MRCQVENCVENEEGYCMSGSYVTIDANGMCDLMRVLPPEGEEEA